jgi:hypothetical protein
VIRKEVVIGGPGSGKSTLLSGYAVEPGAISIDPTGGLRKLVQHVVPVVRYDRHNAAAFGELTAWLAQVIGRGEPALIDVSNAKQADAELFGDEFGYWLFAHLRGGLVVVDEVQWLVNPGVVRHGLITFFGKGRNNGTGAVVSSHRPALMNKSILGMADTLRFGRLVASPDLAAAAKLLKSTVRVTKALDGITRQLPQLQPGQWFTFKAAEPGGEQEQPETPSVTQGA